MKRAVLEYEDGTTIKFEGKAARRWHAEVHRALALASFILPNTGPPVQDDTPLVSEAGDDMLRILPNLSNVRRPE